jgi:predicted transcriptional regulator
MFATMEQFQSALTTFMTDTKNELRSMNEKQMKLINLQSVYEARVRGEVENIYSKTYYVLQQKQEDVFKEYEKHIGEKAFKLEQSLEKATLKCNQSAKRAEESAEKMTSLKEWRDLLQWVSPGAIVLYGLIQLLMWIL